MSPNAKAWLASIGLGLFVGWAMQGLLVLAWPALFGDDTLPDTVLVVTPFVLALVATILLRRAGDMSRRFGWGLSATGVGFLVGALFLSLATGLPEMLLRGDTGRDGAGAVIVLLLALPFMVAGAAMTAVCVVLLRRKPTIPVADSP